MCRNIKTLFNFDPPATDDEIRDAALQFVRKLSGTTRPSQRNEEAFDLAVEQIAAAAREFLDSLETSSRPQPRGGGGQGARQVGGPLRLTGRRAGQARHRRDPGVPDPNSRELPDELLSGPPIRTGRRLSTPSN